MNESNLKPFNEMSPEKVREIGRKGGIASGEARREKKLFREAIEKKLGKSLDSIVDSMIEQAIKGNVQATAFLRDTIGEKPTEKVEAELSSDINIRID
jgi:general stress protein YciG